ncbi:MAG: putative Mg2+ transporter-C (MgtC) family protein [Candidatus Paceibacteria bacterium]|jgi:putative Mg2+ transporter-C (MgtC) family protein
MFLEYFASILIAALVGGLIGIEREYRDKSAGFRTMILIAVGSALFTLLSSTLGAEGGESTRIAAAIVSGVGFLGAGAIIKDGNSVRGLTTAASIWLVASLGMGAGAEQYELVFAVTGVVLLVLWFLPPFERWIDRLHSFLEIHITIKNTEKAEAKILGLLEEAGVRVVCVRRTRIAKGERILHIKIKTSQAKRVALSKTLVLDRSVIAFED